MSGQVSTVARPLAWLPSSSQAPNVKLKPGPPAAAHPQTRSAPGTLAPAEPRAFPVRTGGQLPSWDTGAPRRPSLSRQDARAQLLWEAGRLPCAGDHVGTAVHHQGHTAHALGVQGGSPEQGRLRGLDELHALISTGGLNGVRSACPRGRHMLEDQPVSAAQGT